MPELRGHLELLLLAIIAQEPTHGYAIIDKLRILSGGTFDLAEGAVYPVLHKLEAANLLVAERELHQGRRRKTYKITRAGRAELRTQTQAWERVADGIRAVLEAGTP